MGAVCFVVASSQSTEKADPPCGFEIWLRYGSQSKFQSATNMPSHSSLVRSTTQPSHSSLVRYNLRRSTTQLSVRGLRLINRYKKMEMAPYLARQHARLLEETKRREDCAFRRQVEFSYNERFPCRLASITSSHWRFVSIFLFINSDCSCVDRTSNDG